MTVVALTGRKTAGKDTAAQVLIEKHGYKRLAFADAIKDIVRTLDPIIYHRTPVMITEQSGWTGTDVRLSDLLDGEEHGPWTEELVKEHYPEYRRFAKLLGTEGVRKYDPDFWVNVVMNQIKADPEQNWVITDARFPNEVEAVCALRSLGIDSHVVYIQSDRAEAVEPDHESERWAGNLGEEFTIPNNGTVEELHAAVRDLANSFLNVPANLSATEADDELWGCIECPIRNRETYTPEAHELLRKIGRAA